QFEPLMRRRCHCVVNGVSCRLCVGHRCEVFVGPSEFDPLNVFTFCFFFADAILNPLKSRFNPPKIAAVIALRLPALPLGSLSANLLVSTLVRPSISH